MNRRANTWRRTVLRTALAAAMLVALVVQTPADDMPSAVPLAHELTQLREAWLFGDAAEATARLDVLCRDNRLGGDLPQWLTLMRAWIALEQQQPEPAAELLREMLSKPIDARGHVRAARILLYFGEEALALELVREGRAREPRSIVLARVEAGLLWLSGDHPAALRIYEDLVADSEQQYYPNVAPDRRPWEAATPWSAPAQAERQAWVEPYADLFGPLHWYVSDLPGLDRCLAEMAEDPDHVAEAERGLDALLLDARRARARVSGLRSGNEDERKALESAARRAEFRAACSARILIRSLLANARSEQAEAAAARAVEAMPVNVALLDLYAAALARQGKAEEARTGPLSRLRAITGLTIEVSTILDAGPERDGAERVFAGALNLYRINAQSGRAQFERLTREFARAPFAQGPAFAPVGLWLFVNDEDELAHSYLRRASRSAGWQSGRPMRPEAQIVELALLALEGKAAGTEPEGDEPVQAPPGPPPEDEIEAVDVGDVDRQAHPLLRVAPRAGGLTAALCDTQNRVRRLSGANLHMTNFGAGPLWRAAQSLPGGSEIAQRFLYELPERIAREVSAAELNAILDPESQVSRAALGHLANFGEALSNLPSSVDWRTRQTLTQQSEPVLGVIEARAILLRAKLLRDAPADIDQLAQWLASFQPSIDLRQAARATSDPGYVRLRQERREAGIPEIVHSGLLLDAAVLLAQAGMPLQGAQLIWHNRDVVLGLNSMEALAYVAAVLARQAGDELLATRCMLLSASRPPATPLERPRDAALPLLELPHTLRLLRRIGSADDVMRYLEMHVAPTGDNATLRWAFAHAPEAGAQDAGRLLRAPFREQATEYFASIVRTASAAHVRNNFLLLALNPEHGHTLQRLTAFALLTDANLADTPIQSGLADAIDVSIGWAMLLALLEQQYDDAPQARTRAIQLRRLIQRSGSPGHGMWSD